MAENAVDSEDGEGLSFKKPRVASNSKMRRLEF
jgi:hypothetical protein